MIPVDVRIIAATNRDLNDLISAGSFRRDLFYRLNVVRLALPPLRDRRGDIPRLARHFAQVCSGRARRRVHGISREAISVLEAHHWPGNVRELENSIERAVVLGQNDWIEAEDLPEELHDRVPLAVPGNQVSYHDLVRTAKRNVILDAFERCNFNYADTAARLGMLPNNLHRLINTLELRDELRSLSGENRFSAGAES